MKNNKRTLAAAVLAALLLSAAPARAQRGMGGGMGGGGRSVYKHRRVSVPAQNRPSGGAPSDGRRAVAPERDEQGSRITQRAASAPPGNHGVVARNDSFVHGITAREHTEMTPNHYYWHTEGGVRYAHYYEGGVHWYGFYHGPAFYWTRVYMGRWWWFDVGVGRWVYWSDGYWWWWGPGGIAFVYVDNAYYPYEPEGVAVVTEENQEAPRAIPPPNQGSASVSPDGKRMVQISGADGEAFLYDKTTKVPSYMKFLGRGAEKVRYEGGTAGKPLKILVEFKDGSFAVYDDKGDSPKEPAPLPPADQPPTPDAVPPPPTSAPGQ